MDAVETRGVAVGDDMTGLCTAHNATLKGSERRAARVDGSEEVWERENGGSPAQRGFATSLTEAVSAAHDQLDGVTRRPLMSQ